MTSRPTTLVESDQLAQAAVNILKTEDFVPKGKRWSFSRLSKAHKDYEKAVQEITARRRASRENAVETKLKGERSQADTVLARAKTSAETEHGGKIAEARKPYNEAEAQARNERDAAIAAANLAYQQTMDAVNRTYQEAVTGLDQKRDAIISEATATHTEAYAAIEAKRKSEMARIAQDMKTIPLEGPMRVVEDREAWPVDERKKALIGVVDMAGRDDFNTDYADLCLRNVAGYVFQDRFLKPDAQHHRLMDANLLEAMVDLARRTPEKRPTIVRYLHEIVVHNPGHSSPVFIKGLTELYVIASDDAQTAYAQDVAENEKIFDGMREQIADALKLTPRRSQVPPPLADAAKGSDRVESEPAPAQNAKVVREPSDADITADVDVRELVPLEAAEALDAETDAIAEKSAATSPTTGSRPPPMPPPRRRKRSPIPEGG